MNLLTALLHEERDAIDEVSTQADAPVQIHSSLLVLSLLSRLDMTEGDLLHFTASHSGRTELFTLPTSSATVLELQERLQSLFDVDLSAQKILLPKGRKLPLDSPDAPLSTLLPPSSSPTKLLLIGPTSSSLSSLLHAQSERTAKRQAYAHHAAHPHAPVRNTTNAQAAAEQQQWRFGELRPFDAEVPCLEERRKMLERLSEDRAVRDVMERHK